MDNGLNNKIFITIFVTFFIVSCNTKFDRKKIVQNIRNCNFDKVELALKSGSYTDEEITFYRKLIFDKQLDIALQEIKKSDWNYVKTILSKKEFTDNQYSKLITSIYQIVPNLKIILDNIDYQIPVNTYCGEDTLSEIAVKEQDYDLLKLLIEKGADLTLTDKNNKYNPLFLSIEFHKQNSFEIFKLLLENTIINDIYFEPDNHGNKWYVSKLVLNNQVQMLKVFFESSNNKELFLQTQDCLKDVCAYLCLFDYFNESDFLKIKNIDKQYDYFAEALYGCNPQAIRLLMKLNVSPVITNEKFIDAFLSDSHTNGDIIWQGVYSDGYKEILLLKPVLDGYIQKWCNENQN